MLDKILDHIPVIIILLPFLLALFLSVFHIVTGDCLKSTFVWIWTLFISLCLVICSVILLREIVFLNKPAISYVIGNFPVRYGIELFVDKFNTYVIFLVCVVNLLVLGVIYGFRSRGCRDYSSLFLALWLICVSGISGVVLTGDLFNLYVFVELFSIVMYILVASGSEKHSVMAAFRYFLVGGVGTAFLVLGIGILYFNVGLLNMRELALAIPGVTINSSLFLSVFFILFGLAIKAGLFPVGMWVPRLYTYAPVGVAMLSSSIVSKIPIYALARISIFLVIPILSFFSQYFLYYIFITLLCTILPSIIALFKKDVRAIMAYSSIAQLGYIVFGFLIFNVQGISGALLQFIHHSFIKIAFFALLYHVYCTYSSTTIKFFARYIKSSILNLVLFFICCWSLIGMPGSIGFWVKWRLIEGILMSQHTDVFIVMMVLFFAVSSLATLLYVVRLFYLIYFDDESTSVTVNTVVENSTVSIVPTVILGFCLFVQVLFGVYPTFLLQLVNDVAISIQSGY